jgi:hypothetical protein
MRSVRAHCEVDAQDGGDPGGGGCLDEPDRAVETVAVGQGEDRLAVLGGALDEGLGGRRAVAHREPRRDVQVGELGAHGAALAPVVARSGVVVARAVGTSRWSWDDTVTGRPRV